MHQIIITKRYVGHRTIPPRATRKEKVCFSYRSHSFTFLIISMQESIPELNDRVGENPFILRNSYLRSIDLSHNDNVRHYQGDSHSSNISTSERKLEAEEFLSLGPYVIFMRLLGVLFFFPFWFTWKMIICSLNLVDFFFFHLLYPLTYLRSSRFFVDYGPSNNNIFDHKPE